MLGLTIGAALGTELGKMSRPARRGAILNLNSQLSSNGFVVLQFGLCSYRIPCPDALVMLPHVAPDAQAC
ncbi:hypothetical protein C5167_034820 [Papaver somniferum]|uniref:Uncharacterized protein n=2 Tax=Papaver somniferum TaxID=3469 RepID=A0A4Y7KE35_PAPSO|nr:hypothetical protein C5167_034820 [Papaver somniferum]